MTRGARSNRDGTAALGAVVAVLWTGLSLAACGDTPRETSTAAAPTAVPRTYEEGVAVAIVYDTSGSMTEATKLAKGGTAPKYVVANAALSAIVDRLEQWAHGGAPGTPPRRVEAGLFVFHDETARAAVPMGPLNAAAMRAWMKSFSAPSGPTPLGETVALAGKAALASNLSRKHVLVVTDGESNRGKAPAAALSDLRREAERAKTSVGSHFIAFDVNASVFEPVKSEGATLLGASNEAQLTEQLAYILEKKILLEEEEPPGRGGGPGPGK